MLYDEIELKYFPVCISNQGLTISFRWRKYGDYQVIIVREMFFYVKMLHLQHGKKKK